MLFDNKAVDIKEKLLLSNDHCNDSTMDQTSDAAPLGDQEKKSLNSFEAGQALLSAIIGAGIVGVPFAMISTGIPLGIFLLVAIGALCSYTGYIYITCKDLSPTYAESLFELGYVVLGKPSIYFIAVISTFTGVGC